MDRQQAFDQILESCRSEIQLEQKVKTMEATLRSLNQSVEALPSTWQSAFDLLVDDLDQMRQENQQLKEQLHQAQSTLTHSAKSLETFLQDATHQMNQMRQENQQLKEQIDQMQSEPTTDWVTLPQLTQTTHDLATSLGDELREQLNEQLNPLLTYINELDSNNKTLEENFRSSFHRVSIDMGRVDKRLTTIEQWIQPIQAAHPDLVQRLKGWFDRLKALESWQKEVMEPNTTEQEKKGGLLGWVR